MEDTHEEFDHHGVKGMRWGRRKQRVSASGKGASKSNSPKKQLRSDARTYAKMAKTGTAKNAKQADLQKRMASNKQYAKDVKVRAAINRQKKRLALATIPIAAIMVLPEVLLFVDGVKSSSAAYKANTEAVKKGRKFAESMGLAGRTYIDETGKVLRNFSPSF